VRLTVLNPRIIELILTFDCPCGKCGGRLRVPLDGAMTAKPTWAWNGNLSDLTLHPSINSGCWHGWIKDGEVT
jgi:hypothetical protein